MQKLKLNKFCKIACVVYKCLINDKKKPMVNK